MPAGLLALVAMPFGFDAPVWRLMGYGIDWMTAVAVWVAGLPGAVGRIPAFGIAPLLVGTLGLIVICLLRTPLRWSGAGLLALAAALAAAAPRPDVLISGDVGAVAVRKADGRLAVLKSARQSFAPRDWLGADGDAHARRRIRTSPAALSAIPWAASRALPTERSLRSRERPRRLPTIACAPRWLSPDATHPPIAPPPLSIASVCAVRARSRSVG